MREPGTLGVVILYGLVVAASLAVAAILLAVQLVVVRARRRRVRWTIGIAPVAVFVLLTGAAGVGRIAQQRADDADRTITGVVVFGTPAMDLGGDRCSGIAEHGDLEEGAPVMVTDGAATVLATTVLEGGQDVGARGCKMPFRVHVPAADFYRVQVAGRNPVVYSRSELERRAWDVTLTVGL